MLADEKFDDTVIAEINLTPLVDVSLVLVIIFMVSAPLFSHLFKPLVLPVSGHSALTEANSITISVFPEGALAVGPVNVSEQSLAEEVARQIASGRPPWALVRADAGVTHGRVMDILRIVRGSGVQRVGFAVRREASRAEEL
jgi:biopolymer transport protein ExbD